ncbi:SDR family NAD(P)-dependent oxidoreductase [Hoyosella altamirensis]|uniref:NAD(P)-dependent dehydrogenase (Short-subunit alcohol dehydrogenase family) n=1 Tax=Hoyosella altamirensis TaxID=616997 RepID=A0A839RS67_9ACTN|nr:SDR family NAD(P)-dependent oxidoreductase [Hoyosella altamirensis]MBB3039705.1 NAD(P)-dependent dehydrogenase (short-subunit alcohol dehydrogenase family) [Hoyosella altamirensis]
MTHPQTWFITGTSRGLGKALAEEALRAGHRVVATTRVEGALLEHERLSVCHLDVRDRQACHETVRKAVEQHGAIDVLVNNAGYGLVGAIEEVSEEEARAIIDTDLLGALWLTQAVLPFMRAQRSGHIIQVSSVGGVGALPFFGLYNAAKWGLEGFSEALAGELKEFGIGVTLAEVGAMDTQWATRSMQFSVPLAAYDDCRERFLGTVSVPWASEPEATGGGTNPTEIAQDLLRHVNGATAGDRLRLLMGSDAPGQVAAVLRQRRSDYELDPRFTAAAANCKI